jgi:hypothetical protein
VRYDTRLARWVTKHWWAGDEAGFFVFLKPGKTIEYQEVVRYI